MNRILMLALIALPFAGTSALAEDDLDVTMGVIEDDATEERVSRELTLPESASEQGRESSRQGLDTANEARERGREFGQERAAEGRERGEAAREEAEKRGAEARERGQSGRDAGSDARGNQGRGRPD